MLVAPAAVCLSSGEQYSCGDRYGRSARRSALARETGRMYHYDGVFSCPIRAQVRLRPEMYKRVNAERERRYQNTHDQEGHFQSPSNLFVSETTTD
jgi:hypothetical protein